MKPHEIRTMKVHIEKLTQKLADHEKAIESLNLRMSGATEHNLGTKASQRSVGVIADRYHARP